ncbi:MAG: hypothetical protein ACODAQ_10235 [Phycisphaeraceae bacterium]
MEAMRGFRLHVHLVAVLLAAWLWPAAPVAAQLSGVELAVPRDFVGIGGRLRLGEWTPIRVTLTNRGSEPRAVICRWLLRDYDGDEVIAQRRVGALNPQADESVWLYGVPPVNQPNGHAWTIQVLDEAGERVLASEDVLVDHRMLFEHAHTPIGVMSTAALGLQPYTARDTRHDAVALLRGLELASLPDRWYGLSSVQALIWTSEGGAPVDQAGSVADEMLLALREWVRRGGHLVIVLPSVGQTWTESVVADMLPVTDQQMRALPDAELPGWLYDARPSEPVRMQLTGFAVEGDDDVAVLERAEDGTPVVVAGRHGFGRVTMVGVDLRDRRLVRMGVPSGRFGLWHTIFGWQSPAFTQAYIEAERNKNPPAMNRVAHRDEVSLGRFIPGMIAMRNTAAPALLAAVLVFALYWVLAGPVAYVALRQKGTVQHSWVVFAGFALLFSVVTWVGAWAMQPRLESVSHFSVLDADGRTGEVHAHSWLSLFAPEFGDVHVALGEDAGSAHHTLSSAGHPHGGQGAGFLDRRSYTLDAAAPSAMDVPFRGTAKQFELDYYGRLDRAQPGVMHDWVMPQGRVRVENAWPVGELSHGLPGVLRDVLVVYCPGDGQMPWVWRYDRWAPREVLDLSANRGRATGLVRRPRRFAEDRNWNTEGFLGELIGQRTGRGFAQMEQLRGSVAESELIQAMEMLTFYAMLPPPNFRKGLSGALSGSRPVMYGRDGARPFDVSHLTAGRRLIVLGYLESAPLPAPLTVDERAVDSEGWTMVRWVYDL